MCRSEIRAMLPMKGSSTYAKHTHVQEKQDSIVNEYNKRRKTCRGIGMLGLATLCCHSVSETFRWKDGKG